MPSTDGLRTTSTKTMVRPVKEGFNLNHPPEQFCCDSMIEQLRQTMLQQEVAFRNQVRELHRLYWNQKNLMNEVLWMRSSSASACNKAQERELSTEEQQFNGFELQLQLANSTHRRSILMQFPLNSFHGGERQEATNQFLEMKRTAYGQEMKGTAGGQTAEVGVKCPEVDFGNGEINWSQSCAYANSIIDLEMPAEMEPNEIAGTVRSSGRRTLQIDDVVVSQSGDAVLFDFTPASRMHTDYCIMPLKAHDLPDHNTRKWSETCFYCPDSVIQKSGSITSFKLPTEECQATINHLHIDLNIAQDGAGVDASHDLVQRVSSPSTSSSGITNGDQQNNSSRKCYGEVEQSILCLKQTEAALPVLGHTSSEIRLPNVVEENPPFMMHGSELRSTVTKDGCNFEKHVMNNESCRSGTESPIEFSENSMNTISDSYSGGSYNSTNDISISVRGVTQPEVENVGLSLVPQLTTRHNVNRNAGSSKTSKDGMEDNWLGVSTGCTNLLQSTGRDSQKQQCDNEGIDDDTISSRAVSTCEEQKSVLENSPHCNKFNLSAGNGEFYSENKIAESKIISSSNDFGSKIDAPNPEIDNRNDTPIAYTDDRITNIGVSVPEENVQLQNQFAEMDLMIVKAANTLQSISLENSAYSHPSPDNDKLEREDGPKNDRPQFTSDSFEQLVLKLEELKDDGNSINSTHLEKETVNQFCSVNLRRGRRLRDFQKDILPGLVSLSRHEICEDIHTIKYELRKNRSRRACGQNFLVPVRSRRSRLQKYL